MSGEHRSGRTMESRAFREACGKFATGVTVILSRQGDDVHGMTANAFMSVSLNPLMIAVAVAHTTRMHALLAKDGSEFSVSILSRHQRDLSDTFAGRGNATPRFRRVSPGSVVVDEAVAWMTCHRVDALDAGDHAIVVGRVDAFGLDERGRPLVFYAGTYYDGLEADSNPETEWLLLER